MKMELLNANTDKNGFVFDPRTKLLVLITIATFVLRGAGGDTLTYLHPVLSSIPLFLLLFSKKYKAVLTYIVVFFVGYLGQIFLLPITSGIMNFMILAVSGILTRFLPSIVMGYYVVSTTTVSEFVAAMERMHVTSKIVIPMSVMFRFFPTLGEEYSAINDAMRMRGIRMGGGKPSAMLEYRIVPMMTCSVKIGEELSAAALTRGLGAPNKRTNICKIGFKVQDVFVLALCIFSFFMYFLDICNIF